MNGQVEEYLGLVESLAERLGRSNPNELDDMVQEGLVFVWQSLQKGITPSAEHIENRMLDWLKYRGRQLRHTPTEYETFLPMEDLRASNAQVVSVRPLAGHGPDTDG